MNMKNSKKTAKTVLFSSLSLLALGSIILTPTASADIHTMSIKYNKQETTQQPVTEQVQSTPQRFGLRLQRADGSDSNFRGNNSYTINLNNSNTSNNTTSQTGTIQTLRLQRADGTNTNSNSQNYGYGQIVINNEPITESYTPPQPTNFVAPRPSNINEFSITGCNDDFGKRMLDSINQYRSQNGVANLAMDGDLTGVSCAHSKWMSDNNQLDHYGRYGTSPFDRCSRAGTSCNGENIAYHSQANLDWMMTFFKNSPSHRANLLNPRFTKVGTTLYGIYATQLFAE
jgi:uncharacterized protein YkwD